MKLSLALLLTICLFSSIAIAAPKKHPGAKPEAAAPPPPPKETISPSTLQMRLNALQILHEIKATKDQMAAMQKLASSTAEPAHDRDEPESNPKVELAMQELHFALVQNKDDEKIDSLSDQLDSATESEKVDIDDYVETTDPARKHAPEIAKMLTVEQIANFLMEEQDEIKGPGETLLAGLNDSRKLKGDDWEDARDSAADDAAVMIAGINGSDRAALTDKFKNWLDQAHSMPPEAFRPKMKALQTEAMEMGSGVDSFTATKNWIEGQIAELLSNPQLNVALSERMR